MVSLLSRPVVRELMRFAVGGGGVAVVTVAIYWAAVGLAGIAPLVANAVAFLCQLLLSYRVHRTWSFRAGAASNRGLAKFAAVSVLAFGLNSLWVWLLTGPARWPGWTAIVPMVCVTPLFTYAMARWWVFGTKWPERPGF